MARAENIPTSGPALNDFYNRLTEQFCGDEPQECVDDREMPAVHVGIKILEKVSRDVIRKTRYSPDWEWHVDQHGKPVSDHWSLTVPLVDAEDGKLKNFGDCEDMALEMRHVLNSEYGVPFWQMRIAIVWYPVSLLSKARRNGINRHELTVYRDVEYLAHAVLVYDDQIVENQVDWVGSWKHYVDLGFVINQVTDPANPRHWLQVDYPGHPDHIVQQAMSR